MKAIAICSDASKSNLVLGKAYTLLLRGERCKLLDYRKKTYSLRRFKEFKTIN